jgi:type II secretory pathway pseudopilin PulG
LAGGLEGRPGFTLVELVVGMITLSILMLAVSAAIVLASRAMPGAGENPSSAALQAANAADRIAAELESAVFILEHSQSTIAFTVADRNGDGLPERIRYAWSAAPGDPLTRQYNGGSVTAMVDNVQQFVLVPEIRSVTEAYPGAGVEDAFDSLLVSNDSGSGLSDLDVKSDRWPGQHFAMNLPGASMGWRPTRIRFMVRKVSSSSSSSVQLQPAGPDLKPTSTVLQSQVMDGNALPTSYEWREFSFGGLDRVAPANATCLVLKHLSGTASATVQANAGSGLLTSSNQGLTWAYNSTKSLRCQLYGKVTQPGPTQYAVTQYLLGLRIALKAAAVGREVETSVQTLNQPPLLVGLWEADFSTDPTRLDVNGDGAGDWGVHGGGALNVSTLYGGAWHTSGAALDTSPACDFARLTIAEVRMRGTLADASAVFTINANRSGSVCVPLTAALQLRPWGTQTLTVSRKKSDGNTESLITVRGLPAGFCDVRLLIYPDLNSVSVTVNGSLIGTYGYGAPATTTSDRFATLYATGGTAEFDSVRIRVLEPQP